MDDLLQVLAKTADGVYVVDNEQRLIFWNSSARELLGYKTDEVLGERCYQVIAGRDEAGCPLCRRNCTPFVDSGHDELVPSFDVLVETKDGQERWLNVSIIAIPGDKDQAQAVIHLFRDVTTKKAAEAFALEIANQARNLKFEEPASKAGPTPRTMQDKLTARETQVLTLLANGDSTEAIATKLFVSEVTARNHIQHILSKLGVHSRLEAVLYARQQGLV